MFPGSNESTRETIMLNSRGSSDISVTRDQAQNCTCVLMVYESSVSICLTTNKLIVSGVYSEHL